METLAQRSPTLAPLDAKKANLAFFLVHCATPLLVDQVRLAVLLLLVLKANKDVPNVLQTVTTTALVLLQRTVALRRKVILAS